MMLRLAPSSDGAGFYNSANPGKRIAELFSVSHSRNCIECLKLVGHLVPGKTKTLLIIVPQPNTTCTYVYLYMLRTADKETIQYLSLYLADVEPLYLKNMPLLYFPTLVPTGPC